LLVLRVDRQLSWGDIALAFVDEPATCSDDERRREAARLRKRFQLGKERLAKRARAEGLL
jgi:RNA polymerase sigma-70 factor, ECF subfamily